MRYLFLLVTLLPVVAQAQQLATARQLALYRAVTPADIPRDLQDVLDRAMWYTDVEIPPAFQFDADGDGNMTFHYTGVNISQEQDPFGNGNKEWPWDHPAVAKDDGSVKNIKSIYLPEPVVWYERSFRTRILTAQTGNFERRGIAWILPNGTDVIELITTKVGKQDICFKIFRLTKSLGAWKRRVYRPKAHLSPESLVEVLGRDVRIEDTTRTVSDSRRGLNGPNPLLIDGRHDKPAFSVIATARMLPFMSQEDVIKCLESPFELCTEEQWIPSTRFQDQSVPQFYLGPWLSNGNRERSCVPCHQDTLSHVFVYQENRDWYAFFRGSDGIFSFHPISKDSVSINGKTIKPRFNTTLVQAGLVEKYDSTIHSSSLYTVP